MRVKHLLLLCSKKKVSVNSLSLKHKDIISSIEKNGFTYLDIIKGPVVTAVPYINLNPN